MSQILKGRYTASANQDFVVFIIGMRINKWWKFQKWVSVVMAMTKMLIKLAEDRSLGMHHGENFIRLFPLTTITISYWDSFEHLERFATDKSLPHAEEWSSFMRKVGGGGDVGIYHETFKVKRGDFECLYGNMPKFGLGAAFGIEAVGPGKNTARDRISNK